MNAILIMDNVMEGVKIQKVATYVSVHQDIIHLIILTQIAQVFELATASLNSLKTVKHLFYL